MPFNLVAYKNRTTDFDFPIYEDDGTTPVILASGDVVRIKLSLAAHTTPALDIDSVGATGNGSVVTLTLNPGLARLRLAQADTTALVERLYFAEVAVVDESETAPADAIKVVDRGTIEIQASQGGDVGVS